MTWLLFALIGVVGIAGANIIERVLLKDEKSDAFAYSFVFQILCSILIGIVAAINGFSMPPLQGIWINILIMSFFYAAGTYFLFKAFQKSPASEVVIVFSTRAIWTILTASIFLGETLNPEKIMGALLIFAGVFLVSLNGAVKKGAGAGIVYALAAAFFWGTAFTNDGYVLRYADMLSYSVIAFFFPAVALLAMRPKLLFELKPIFNFSFLRKMTVLCVFYSIATVADYHAITIGADVSQLGPILQSAIVLTVILAAIFLGERDNLIKKILAALIATVGVVMVS